MERVFQIIAAVLVMAAAYFYLSGYSDATFGAAVFAAVSFFLSYRFRVKERLDQNEAETPEPEDT